MDKKLEYLIEKLEAKTGKKVELVELFGLSAKEKQAALLDDEKDKAYIEIELVDEGEYFADTIPGELDYSTLHKAVMKNLKGLENKLEHVAKLVPSLFDEKEIKVGVVKIIDGDKQIEKLVPLNWYGALRGAKGFINKNQIKKALKYINLN